MPGLVPFDEIQCTEHLLGCHAVYSRLEFSIRQRICRSRSRPSGIVCGYMFFRPPHMLPDGVELCVIAGKSAVGSWLTEHSVPRRAAVLEMIRYNVTDPVDVMRLFRMTRDDVGDALVALFIQTGSNIRFLV